MDVVIYAAKSTVDEKGSIETQLANCEKMAAREHWTVLGTYKDENKSAYTGNRGPDLEAARRHAEAAAPCVLLVQHSDRLARGAGDAPGAAEHLGEILFWARRHDVHLRSVQDDASLTNPLLAMMMGERNYEDSKRKSEAVKSGKRREFEKGNWPGGPVPDGYVYDKQAKTLLRDPGRAPVIRLMFTLALKGLSTVEIARKLNEAGYTTRPAPKIRHSHDGLPWHGSRVQEALANPVYAGRVVINRRSADERVGKGNWEALIDPQTFDRVGMKIGFHTRGRGGRPTSDYALSGLAVCDRCGRRMSGRKDPYVRKDGTQLRAYVCANKVSGGTCDAPRVDAERIDSTVIGHLRNLFIDVDAWKGELAQTAEKQRALVEGELARRRKTLDSWQQKRDSARARYFEKETPAREDALEHAIEQHKAAQERYDESQRLLAAIPDEVPIDAMLDASNELQRMLNEGGAPINERLKRVFSQFRIGWADENTIAVLPVLRPDVIESHAAPDGKILVFGPDWRTDPDSVSLLDADSPETPVMLVVPPPSKLIEVSLIGEFDNAWAWHASKPSFASRLTPARRSADLLLSAASAWKA